MIPPKTVHTVALYMAVMFAAVFDGLQVGQVKYGGPDLPASPWPRAPGGIERTRVVLRFQV